MKKGKLVCIRNDLEPLQKTFWYSDCPKTVPWPQTSPVIIYWADDLSPIFLSPENALLLYFRICMDSKRDSLYKSVSLVG